MSELVVYNTKMLCARCGRYAYHQLHYDSTPPDPTTALCDRCAGRADLPAPAPSGE